MSLDSELKELLAALVTGQVKHDERLDRLAESQRQLDATVKHLATATEGALSRLTASQERTDATVNRLGEKVDRFGEKVDRFGEKVEHLTDRVDSFTKVIMEGFTSSASRDRHLEDDVRALEARVTKLEHAPTPG